MVETSQTLGLGLLSISRKLIAYDRPLFEGGGRYNGIVCAQVGTAYEAQQMDSKKRE